MLFMKTYQLFKYSSHWMLQNYPIRTSFLKLLIFVLPIILREVPSTCFTKFWHSFNMLNPFSSKYLPFLPMLLRYPKSPLPLGRFGPFRDCGCYIWSKTRQSYLHISICYDCIQNSVNAKKLHYYPFLAK